MNIVKLGSRVWSRVSKMQSIRSPDLIWQNFVNSSSSATVPPGGNYDETRLVYEHSCKQAAHPQWWKRREVTISWTMVKVWFIYERNGKINYFQLTVFLNVGREHQKICELSIHACASTQLYAKTEKEDKAGVAVTPGRSSLDEREKFVNRLTHQCPKHPSSLQERPFSQRWWSRKR